MQSERFRPASQVSALSGDQFLQTRRLMNLGVVALQEEHYEDALASFSDASTWRGRLVQS